MTTSEKKKVLTHPPLEEIKIVAQGVEIIASPFKTINTKEEETRTTRLKDIKGLQQQSNFTNQILETISSQLDRIEKNIPKPKEIEREKPLFRNLEINKPLKLGRSGNEDLIKALTQRLEAINLNGPSTSKDQINFLSGYDTESLRETIQTNESENYQINRIKNWNQRTKNFYPRPTPLDLQFKEIRPPKTSI